MYKTAKEALAKFIQLESTSGLLILCAAAVALLMENSPFSHLHDFLLTRKFAILFEGEGIEKPVLLWINDGLMAIFFLLVSLEIKREVIEGQLSTKAQRVLPSIAALGGIIAPALIFTVLNTGNAVNLRGWAIPMATDIAFAICVVSLLGRRFVPEKLKTFLLAVAIIDDIAAILIIAFFYTTDLNGSALMVGLVAFLVLLILNLMNTQKISIYILVGTILWWAILKSGIHATVAGVLVAATIPIRLPNSKFSPLKALEKELHPWVVYVVMPLFAFANAGVSFAGLRFADILHPIPLGIILGLFVGKPVGIFASTFLAVKTNVSKLPPHSTWTMILALGFVCGVGFTMSLFIGTLAFSDPEINRYVRLGVLFGSFLSALVGYGLFRLIPSRA